MTTIVTLNISCVDFNISSFQENMSRFPGIPEGSSFSVMEKHELKRPRTAYNFFCMEKIGELKQSPRMKYRSIGKVLGKMWKDSTLDISEYVKKAEQEKYLWDQGVPIYKEVDVTPFPHITETGEHVWSYECKDEKELKRPRTAYNFFCMMFEKDIWPEMLEENPDLEFLSLGKIMGSRWRYMDEEDKVVYYEMSEDEKYIVELGKVG